MLTVRVRSFLLFLGALPKLWALQRLPGPVANPLNSDGDSIAQEILIGALAPHPPYIVQAGETLEGIATKFGTTVACLEGANPQVSDPSLLCAGESLSIPNSNATIGYAVCPGDTLSSIAKQFGISLSALQQANPAVASLRVDEVITVPNICDPVTQSDLFSCGNANYYVNSYSCFTGDELCPVSNGIPTYPCGEACYATSHYTCYPGNQLCPVSNGIPTLPCGTACYSPTEYSCQDGSLVQAPRGQCTVSTNVSSSGCPRTSTQPSSTPHSSKTTTTSGQTSNLVSISSVMSNQTSGSNTVSQPSGTGPSQHSTSITTSHFSNTTSHSGATTGPTTSFSGSQASRTTSLTSAPTEIVIGGQTFTIGTKESTVTVNSHTLVIGPGGIEVGSSTITLPSGVLSTAITSDGLTFTLDEPPPPTHSPSLSSQSSQLSSGASSGSKPSNPASTSFTEIEIGGKTFTIGSKASTVTISSETIVIGPSGVEVNSTPLTLPSVISSDFVTDGITFTVGHASAPTSLSASSTASSTPVSSTSFTEIEIGGQTFTLGGSKTVTVTISSETIVIGPSGVGVNSTPINLPSNIGSSALISDGITFTVGHAGGGLGVSAPTSTSSTPASVVGAVPITLETGSFTTRTLTGISGFTGYSSTSTDINGHHTILPLWPCLFPPIPACAIIIEPLGPEPDGEEIPPPPCQPVIEFVEGEIVAVFEGLLRRDSDIVRRQIAGDPACIVRFTETQTETLSDVGGALELSQPYYDADAPTDLRFVSALPTITSIQTSVSFAPATTLTPTSATETCDPTASTQAVSLTAAISFPTAASIIDIFMPIANTQGTNWDVKLAQQSGPDPNVVLNSWVVRINADNGFPQAQGVGNGQPVDITWNTPAQTMTIVLELDFNAQTTAMVFTLTLTGSNPCTPAQPPSSTTTAAQPTFTGGFWLDAVISDIVSDDQVHLFGDSEDPNTACLSLLANTVSGFVFVEDLTSKDSGKDAARFLFSPGNGFIITDNVQLPFGGTDDGTLCGIKGNVMTLLAAGDGGLTFKDASTSGTCTSTATPVVETCTTDFGAGTTAQATMSSVWHCSASGSPSYCN